MTSRHPKTVAFYLPQFHAIPENDEWWGEGFTEWTNVRRARRQYADHDHPRVPGSLGHYDLSQPEDVICEQVRLARAAHVDAFCFYFYWFDGFRLLEKPVEWFRNSGPDFPYCLSWANESWTRRWDGKSRHVLMGQPYKPGFARAIFDDLRPHFLDDKYLRVKERPVFVVHRITDLPNAHQVASDWRRLAREAGLSDLYLVAAETEPGVDPTSLGFDAAVEFPPVGSNTAASAHLRPLRGLRKDFRGRLLSYERMAERFMNRPQPNYPLHRGVAPGWDNTARRGNRATIYLGNNPSAYAKWLAAARREEASQRGGDGLVFVNAWNEWAEGAYLEPDGTHGDAFLRATRRDHEIVTETAQPSESGRWSFAQLRSVGVLIAGSLVSWMRRARGRVKQVREGK